MVGHSCEHNIQRTSGGRNNIKPLLLKGKYCVAQHVTTSAPELYRHTILRQKKNEAKNLNEKDLQDLTMCVGQ